MKPQKFYEGKITRLDRKGRGVFDVTLPDGQTRPMFVPFTSPGDVIQTRYMGRKKGIYFGKLEKVIKAGPHRIDPPAPGLENYPGTPWLHIEYKTQLAYKRDMLNEAFKSQGHKERISEVEACPIIHHYRNRMDYTFGWRGELGLREYGFWHKYFNITRDILLCEEASDILAVCRDLVPRFGLKPWDHKKLEGDLRYVVIRDIKSTGQRMIGLIVKDLSKINEPVREYLKTSLDKYATNILLGENPDITDVSTAQTTQILKGNPSVTEELNGVHYKMYLNSFFQTNSTTAARLLEIVGQYINNSNKSPTWVKRGLGALLHPVRINTSGTNPSNLPLRLINGRIFQILDLYCGLGFFGIYLAKKNPHLRVSGFEIDEQAIELAKKNAEINGVSDRCLFVAGKSEDLSWKDIDADVVIVDPPRAGLHPKVIKTLLEKKPRSIIYVSCNYPRLVEDLKELKAEYKIADLHAIDQFPNTPHVEVICHLERSREISFKRFLRFALRKCFGRNDSK